MALVELPEWFKPGALVEGPCGHTYEEDWVACHVVVSVRKSAPYHVEGSLAAIFHDESNVVMPSSGPSYKTMLILRMEEGIDDDSSWKLFVEYHTSSGETVIGAYTPRDRDDKSCFSFGFMPL